MAGSSGSWRPTSFPRDSAVGPTTCTKNARAAYLLASLALAACSSSSGGKPDASVVPSVDAGPSEDAGTLADAAPAEDAQVDSGQDAAEPTDLCPAERIVEPGCQDLSGLSEGQAQLCDGLDNDCNGVIDDGCPCVAGSVQECFLGPPGRAGVGACRKGIQVCYDDPEFPGWGLCEQGISPSAEVCDRLDNDCNGCVDEREDCDVFIDCPGPNDPRIPKPKPFETITLDAAQFYNGNDVAKYSWTVEGSPCDRLFASIPGSNANATNGRLSYKLEGANQQKAKIRFTLSGTYLVTFNIVRKTGQTLSCTFPLIVGAGGLRVELCWDKTGPTAGKQAVDLDLHLALKNRTPTWTHGLDCYYDTCVPKTMNSLGIWGHPNTPGTSGCITGGGLDQVHMLRGNCINPRIDIDNQGEDRTRYLPENINLDNPRAGEVFQVSVNHTSPEAVRTRALVNVFCGGKLKGSYELDPQVTAFSDLGPSDEHSQAERWHVVEVAPKVNAAGVTTDCSLTPLVDPSGSGPLITAGDLTIYWAQ